MTIASNYAPYAAPQAENFELSKENVTIRIGYPSGTRDVVPTAVFSGQGIPPALLNDVGASGNQRGAFVTVAVFDVPADLPITIFPATVTLKLRVGTAAPSNVVAGSLDIIGLGATPTSIVDRDGYDLLDELASRPMLRLRAVGGSGAFQPSWVIGSLEFNVVYPSTVQNPQAYPASEAFRAASLIGPGSTSNTRHIVLVDPQGFSLPDVGTAEIGEGPLVDLVFAKLGHFDKTDFQIRDLVVTDVNGVTLLNRRNLDSTALFTRYVAGNQ